MNFIYIIHIIYTYCVYIYNYILYIYNIHNIHNIYHIPISIPVYHVKPPCLLHIASISTVHPFTNESPSHFKACLLQLVQVVLATETHTVFKHQKQGGSPRQLSWLTTRLSIYIYVYVNIIYIYMYMYTYMVNGKYMRIYIYIYV